MEWERMMGTFCLLAGALFGAVGPLVQKVAFRGAAAGGPGRSGQALEITVDLFKTAAACLLCRFVLAPELEAAAVLYAGAGALLGHVVTRGRHPAGNDTAAVVCAWVTLYLPITGAVCVLAGLVVALGTGRLAWGMALVPALAAPAAWLQFGGRGSLWMLGAALLLCFGRGGVRSTLPKREKNPPLSPKE